METARRSTLPDPHPSRSRRSLFCLSRRTNGRGLIVIRATILLATVSLLATLVIIKDEVSLIRNRFIAGSSAPWPKLSTVSQGRLHEPASGEATVTSSPPVAPFSVEAQDGQPVIPNLRDPLAVDSQSICPGYLASNVIKGPHGLTAELSLAGSPCNVYGSDIDTLSLIVEHQSQDRLKVEIIPKYLTDTNISYYLIPDSFVRKPTRNFNAPPPEASDLEFSWTNEPTFSFTVTRRTNGDVLFSTRGRRLVFEDQFLEFGTELPPNYNVYGLGEAMRGFRLGGNLTLYNIDQGNAIDGNMYGAHPHYLETRYSTDEHGEVMTTSKTHGVYLRNAHGQEVVLQEQSLIWRTIGGSIDLYFLAGPTPAAVTSVYQKEVIELPAMQQYWTLGYHQCRWGYSSWEEMEAVVDNFERFQIPLEAIWNDIDLYNHYRDFTNDPDGYPLSEGQRFLQRLHDSGRHYVPIVDTAIYIPNPENSSDPYPPFENGKRSNSFLRNPDGSLYAGLVWPGITAFPDWLSKGAGPWFTQEVMNWHEKIPFDGIWLDMNEASSFCVGSCGSNNITMNPVHVPFKLPGESGNIIYDYPEGFNISNATEAAMASSLSASQSSAAATTFVSPSTTTSYLRTTPTPGVRNINYPPYALNNFYGDLAVHAVSPNATHADGTLEYDIHNLYGHQTLNVTYNALLTVFPGKRPFIVGRSTFAGSGKFSAHWGGDNYSRWLYMALSIPQALSFSLFGIPFFGVDTCGFFRHSSNELCGRWMSLSAFFPFYRSHNVLSANPQEPYRWASVIEASKLAMSIRYAILPYMYTLLYKAHTRGETVMRALAWEFPTEPAFASADRQFLLGPSILVTPVLEPGVSSVKGVFPGVNEGEIWYDWYNQTAVDGARGQNITIDAPLGHIPVFLRGGSILALHNMTLGHPPLTVREARERPWALLTALSRTGTASGDLYLDDGESLEPVQTALVGFSAANNQLSTSISGSYPTNPFESITILGVAVDTITTVSWNETPLSSYTYNSTSKILFIRELSKMTSKGAFSTNWTLEWT